jgi:hypothetical protein
MYNSYKVLKAIFKNKDENDDIPSASWGNSKEAPAWGPTRELDGGYLACGSSKDYGESPTFFTLDAITAAAEEFCKERVAAPFKWSGADAPDPTTGEASYEYLMTEPGDDEAEALVSLTWYSGSGQYFSTPEECPELDMGAPDALQLCKDRFGLIINNCECLVPHVFWQVVHCSDGVILTGLFRRHE